MIFAEPNKELFPEDIDTSFHRGTLSSNCFSGKKAVADLGGGGVPPPPTHTHNGQIFLNFMQFSGVFN